jgi:hypothetical protein
MYCVCLGGLQVGRNMDLEVEIEIERCKIGVVTGTYLLMLQSVLLPFLLSRSFWLVGG